MENKEITSLIIEEINRRLKNWGLYIESIPIINSAIIDKNVISFGFIVFIKENYISRDTLKWLLKEFEGEIGDFYNYIFWIDVIGIVNNKLTLWITCECNMEE